MEPKILIIGRKQEVIDILLEELEHYGRHVVGTNSERIISQYIRSGRIDLVVMGAGLDDESRDRLKSQIHSINPDLAVTMIERSPEGSPHKMIAFVNEQALNFKIERALGDEEH